MKSLYVKVAIVEGVESVIGELRITPPAAGEVRTLSNGNPAVRPVTETGLDGLPASLRAIATATYTIGPESVTKTWSVDEVAARSFAVLTIDVAAETERKKYITAGEGQAMVYRQKQFEAAEWLDAESPDADDFPMLKARAERLNAESPDYDAVAAEWAATSSAWMAAAAHIENVREAAKESVVDATVAEVVAILDALDFSAE